MPLEFTKYRVHDRNHLTRCIFEEAKRQRLGIQEIADRGKLDRRTLQRMNNNNPAPGVHSLTLHKLAQAIGGRIAIVMDDGRVLDPMKSEGGTQMSEYEEDGYYWVRNMEYGDWEVAQFCNGEWWFPGNDYGVAKVHEVGFQIHYPG